jgi:hypothetical protein
MLALVLTASACGGGGTDPSPSVDVTGRWIGTASDSSGAGEMAWEVQQTGDSFAGTMTLTDGATGYKGRGDVSGTVSGSKIEFSIIIPLDGFDEPWAACAASVSGTAQVGSTSLTGSYTGSNVCTGGIDAGRLSLSR